MRARAFLVVVLLAVPSLGWAEGDEPLQTHVHGDVKTFFLAGAPYAWFRVSEASAPALEASGLSEDEVLRQYGFASDPFASGIGNVRLKADATWREVLRLDVQWAVAAQNRLQTAVLPGTTSGVGLRAPEAVVLTWTPDVGPDVALQHRFDRLVLSARLPGVDVALGRQPISFGSGRFFTPFDLVNPFHPATIDTEYKPGVDAARVDAYVGAGGRFTLATAYAGTEPLTGKDRSDATTFEDFVIAGYGQWTVGVTDLMILLGAVHAEAVLGAGAVSSIGPVGVRGEATLTIPGDGAEPFVRAMTGADWRPTTTTTLSAEVYVQSFGAADPRGYLDVVSDERFTRGEVWQLGRVYAGISAAQEITPLIFGHVAIVSNLADPSALVVLAGSWSVADNVVVGFGANLGVGQSPDVVELDLTLDPMTMAPVLTPPSPDEIRDSVRSEFGLYPQTAYLQVRTYF